MPPYLSPAWVQAFNAALEGLDLTEAITAASTGSVTASRGTFGVTQIVTGGPDGDVRVVLSVDQGRITLEVDPTGGRPSDVTIVVTYADALSLARGELDPADALAAGRVRVRGELAVLVAGQAVLTLAAAKIGRSLTDLSE
jgi:putative sterol carrier protein